VSDRLSIGEHNDRPTLIECVQAHLQAFDCPRARIRISLREDFVSECVPVHKPSRQRSLHVELSGREGAHESFAGEPDASLLLDDLPCLQDASGIAGRVTLTE
jgi:hypothetical protein